MVVVTMSKLLSVQAMGAGLGVQINAALRRWPTMFRQDQLFA
jgi:hypothetical protein